MSHHGRLRPCRAGMAALLLLAGLLPACSQRQQLTIFCAASLSRVASGLGRRFAEQHPGWQVVVEPSGSQVAARKVAELGRRADLVLSADWRVLRDILLPEHAPWLVQFCSNEIVLAYGPHSPHAEEMDAGNWPRWLLAEGVRLARANERTAPIGFQTLQVWQLAERHYAGKAWAKNLASNLRARVAPRHVVDDIDKLVGLLQTRAVDYVFVFRSSAEEYRLQFVALPAAINLGDPGRADTYARVAATAELGSGRRVQLPARPVIYGACIPASAVHARQAAQLLRMLLEAPGAAELRRSGFRPLQPASCRGSCTKLPGVLAPLLR